ncbi:MAG: hypothetical protein WD625_12590 [Balneolales bacterium]
MKLPPNTGLSCNNSFEDTELIDYDELDKIKVEIALEIGESDEYIPGHMGQLFLASDGTMLVSDGQAVEHHMVYRLSIMIVSGLWKTAASLRFYKLM